MGSKRTGAILKMIVHSIGYQGRSIDEVIQDLLANSIEILIDVRRNAWSRKKGFSKSGLEIALESNSVGYIHMPGLGISSDERKGLRTPEDYHILLSGYRRSLAQRLDLVDELIKISEKDRVALMCFERDPALCHRSVLVDIMQERGFSVIEL
jgi:uncharacterized protein (DUF488 family)